MIYNLIPFGDYCRGLLNALHLIFFGGMFLLLFLIICSINVYDKVKNKNKFDLIPVILFLTFAVFLYALLELDYSRFWTTPTLMGSVSLDNSPKSGYLTLYKDGTFEATYNSADFSCTYVGSYKIDHDTLKLERTDLSTETDALFATGYLISTRKKELKPLHTKYRTIAIIE